MASSTTHTLFNIDHLKTLRNQTPFFVFNKQVLLNNLKKYQQNLPQQTEICYAMKANSEKVVLKTLSEAGVSFEVASKYELALLKPHKVPPEKIIYGTAVKPVSHIREFAKYGVSRFAFDSFQELEKIAHYAPGAKVYARVLVDDRSDSIFHMSEKFGSKLEQTVELFVEAKKLGLKAYGISFNVGSQARSKDAWGRGINDLKDIMEKLQRVDIKIEVINLGGGFPFSYQVGDGMPGIEIIGKSIKAAIQHTPYPVKFIAEPGRGLVADAFILITSIIERNIRSNGEWLYIDAGVYNALFEAMAFQGLTQYKVETLKVHTGAGQNYVLTGPTGDNIDVINSSVALPVDVRSGEKLVIHDVGAYTFTLSTKFNGFPTPRTLEV